MCALNQIFTIFVVFFFFYECHGGLLVNVGERGDLRNKQSKRNEMKYRYKIETIRCLPIQTDAYPIHSTRDTRRKKERTTGTSQRHGGEPAERSPERGGQRERKKERERAGKGAPGEGNGRAARPEGGRGSTIFRQTDFRSMKT
jgi:hypothetical protein